MDNENMKQIVLCRDGQCIDVYYDEKYKVDAHLLECETLKEALFGGMK